MTNWEEEIYFAWVFDDAGYFERVGLCSYLDKRVFSLILLAIGSRFNWSILKEIESAIKRAFAPHSLISWLTNHHSSANCSDPLHGCLTYFVL